MLTDIQIAQKATLFPIGEIAEKPGFRQTPQSPTANIKQKLTRSTSPAATAD